MERNVVKFKDDELDDANTYGCDICGTRKDFDEETVQQKIYEIKNKFYEEGFNDWTIEDVLAKFPTEWDWEYNQTDSNIEI